MPSQRVPVPYLAFYGKVSFCGGVDTQELLAKGTPEQVYQRVQELKTLFPTGLIVSPSHEALLADVDPKNVEVTVLFYNIQIPKDL